MKIDDIINKVHCADCFDFMKDIPCGQKICVITDPVWPYASGCIPGQGNAFEVMEKASFRFVRFAQRAVIHLGCDSDPRFLQTMPSTFPFIRTINLKYVFPHPKGRILYTGDIAYFFGEPPPPRPGFKIIPGECLDKTSDGKQTNHPCPRKLAHVKYLVAKCSAEDDIILDPFCGSGTTAVAAKALGRRFIAIDIKQEYCNMAEKYLNNTTPCLL